MIEFQDIISVHILWKRYERDPYQLYQGPQQVTEFGNKLSNLSTVSEHNTPDTGGEWGMIFLVGLVLQETLTRCIPQPLQFCHLIGLQVLRRLM